ncbi:hypothetical protein [Alkalihalophilus marmarensis]|uniref:hypothetical protein n=1 Tax=Alkalihalophilus marmarensis TaxID=521377 RepID=UPI002DBED28C|nr:hypothetical protein [Alkalihalophilus marmarensis]MEC2072766.1 hypothetical protein [Alkalihalophilus marmarensis]
MPPAESEYLQWSSTTMQEDVFSAANVCKKEEPVRVQRWEASVPPVESVCVQWKSTAIVQ